MPGHTFLYSPPVNASRDLHRSPASSARSTSSRRAASTSASTSPTSASRGTWARTTSRSCGTGSARRRRHVGAISRGCVIPDDPGRRLHRPRVRRRARSRTSSSPGSRRASSVGRRSSAREKMVVYDDTSNEPVRVFDSGVHAEGPEDVRRVPADLPDRRHRLAHVPAAEPLLLEMATSAARSGDGRHAALVRRSSASKSSG